MRWSATRLRHLYDLADALSSHFAVPIEITDSAFSRILLADRDASGAPVGRRIATPASLAGQNGQHFATRDIVRDAGVDVLGIPGFTVIPLVTAGSRDPEAYLWLIEVNLPLPDAHVEHIRTVAMRTFEAVGSLPVDDEDDGTTTESTLLLETDTSEFMRRLEQTAIAKRMPVGTPVFAISVLVEPRDAHYETSEQLRTAVRKLIERIRGTGGPRRAILAAAAVEAVALVTTLEGEAENDAERIISSVQDELFRLRAKSLTHDWSIGVSNLVHPWEDAYAAVWQARQAAVVGARVQWRDARIDWRDAAPYRGVSSVSPSLLRTSFLTPRLERFLTNAEDEDLVGTLRSYLRHAGNVQAVAAEQFLHRGTVYYRLRRVETLLGVDLTDGNSRLAIHLGLLSWNLVADAAGQAREQSA
ncbi:PucR family transcriptional regulator [Microbacterium sp. gxy059]|uniref:PucR family transcriptional regulator n=1 Tax=Microbacterium sp. gxy059 TaxID=2957199 RepID=UPI003D972FEF